MSSKVYRPAPCRVIPVSVPSLGGQRGVGMGLAAGAGCGVSGPDLGLGQPGGAHPLPSCPWP